MPLFEVAEPKGWENHDFTYVFLDFEFRVIERYGSITTIVVVVNFTSEATFEISCGYDESRHTCLREFNEVHYRVIELYGGE